MRYVYIIKSVASTILFLNSCVLYFLFYIEIYVTEDFSSKGARKVDQEKASKDSTPIQQTQERTMRMPGTQNMNQIILS